MCIVPDVPRSDKRSRWGDLYALARALVFSPSTAFVRRGGGGCTPRRRPARGLFAFVSRSGGRSARSGDSTRGQRAFARAFSTERLGMVVVVVSRSAVFGRG
jgi:hypothetical protein